jgi:hypothetical protein
MHCYSHRVIGLDLFQSLYTNVVNWKSFNICQVVSDGCRSKYEHGKEYDRQEACQWGVVYHSMCVARVLPVVRLGVMNCTGGWGWLLVGLLGWVDFEILEKKQKSTKIAIASNSYLYLYLCTTLHFNGKFVEILYSCTLTDMYCCTRSIVVLPGSLVLLLSRARNFNFNEHAQIKIKNGLVTAPGLVSNYA